MFFKKLINPNEPDANQDITCTILIMLDYEGYGVPVDQRHLYLAQQVTV